MDKAFNLLWSIRLVFDIPVFSMEVNAKNILWRTLFFNVGAAIKVTALFLSITSGTNSKVKNFLSVLFKVMEFVFL